MSPVPIAIEASLLGSGSAVTTAMCGARPFRFLSRLRASAREFCVRSLRIVHLQERWREGAPVPCSHAVAG